MCGCRKPIGDWRSKISEDLHIPEGNILAIDANTYSAKVSQTYVDYTKSGKYDFDTLQNIQSSMKPQDLQSQDSVPMIEVLITVLPIAECQSNIADGNGTTNSMYSQSFAAALDMVTDTNQNEMSKGVIRSNSNSYNSMQVIVSNSTDRASCEILLEKMFEGCVICHQQRESNSDAQVPVLFEKSVRNESKDGSRPQDVPQESIEECSSCTIEDEPKKLGTGFLDSKGLMTGDGIMANGTHVNMRKPISILLTQRVVYVINLLPIYTVHHALMYSPAVLPSDKIKTLFVFYQLLQFMSTFGDKFLRNMGGLRWDDIAFDSHGWINVFLPASSYLAFESNDSTLENEENSKSVTKNYQIDLQRLPELLDKWMCCELSTFDYLMFLNKLAGRSVEDPNHHPILPWISTLESENGSWRDLTKSKYRLNKGDHQLDLQYTMMSESAQMKDEKSLPNLPQVPHHVPEFLSDITYYVYTARRTPKDVLCKLVRSYWEPNEYPASIQRMQAWTPDECIPEFYTDPGVFISMHNDMVDLAVPDWCSDAANFISKHRRMLESDEVSLSLHHWIDVTFGCKLSGQDSVEAKNVCFPLVDNHDTLTKRGITQLFDVPHPRRRYCKKEPAGLGNPEIDGGDLQLPASYNPRQELKDLEKLLVFRTKVCNNADMSPSLVKSLAQCCDKMTSHHQKQKFLSDRNVVVLLCLMIELYLPLQTRTIANDLSLSERFKCCLHYFKVYKSRLPCGIRFAMEYFIRNLRRSERETIEQLLAGVEESRSYCSIFKTVSDKGLPTPTPTLLCSQYIHIFPFPPYFKDLYDVLELVLRLTDNYSKPLPYCDLDCVTQKIHSLYEKLDETEDFLEIFIPHIQQLLKQKTDNAAEFLLANFEAISKGMGMKASLDVLSPLILQIYNDSHEVDTAGKSLAPLVGLYQRTFLLQLSTRLGLHAFLQNIPSCLADALMMNFNSRISETSQQSICWLMERIGPTLTSKYIVRHLFRVLTQCFILGNGRPVVEFESSHVKAVLDCLIHAAELYGASIITLQYFAHLIHSILSAVGHPKYAPRHQAAVEASVSAVTFFISYLTDTVLMEQLTRISKDMIVPVVELLGRSDLSFYGGAEARKSLCLKIIHLMALIVIRIGREMSREHLTPLFLSFFSHYHPSTQVSSSAPQSIKELDGTFEAVDDDAEIIIDHDSDTRTVKIGSTVLEEGTTGLRKQLHKSWFVDSPTSSPNKSQQIPTAMNSGGSTHPEQEIAATFCAETAYCSYVSFTRLLGDIYMQRILGRDHDHIWQLSLEHEKILGEKNELMSYPPLIHSNSPSDITMIGNRLIVESQMSEPDMKPANKDDPDIMTTLLTSVGGYRTEDQLGSSIRRILKASSSSQLTENWLAYWEHEIGLPENDRHIHFNQIELQGFAGHNAAVRCLSAHTSEEWFISGGKDKTVKIWSLCSDGENRTKLRSALAPSHSYNSHKKAVTCIGIVESEQLVVSNDGNIHAWDPYTCQQVQIYDSSDVKTGFALLATLSSPQRYALAITNDADLRFIDFRRKCLAHEFKTIVGNSIGIPRAMCASSDSNRVAVGFSTGMVSTIDIRVGTVLSMKPAHEADISTMAVMSEKRYVTASTDQTVAMWEFDCSSPITVFRSFQEPVHTVQKFNDEIISASLAGRVLVHSLPGPFGLKCAADQPVAVSKLRSDSLKGNLIAFCVLPMKRQILLASDSGNIKLMA